MKNLDTGDLQINVTDDSGVLAAHWIGKSIDRQPQRHLDPYFASLLEEASKRRFALEMHFERLVHFNSSTIGCLIRLVQDCRSREVKLSLVYNAKVSWQRLSFDALRVFLKDNPFFALSEVTL